MENKRASIKDVARRAGVSITTVSRVINNFPTVSAANRAKVESAVAALKFKPNVTAQRLVKGVTNAVGLVMPGYPGIFHSFYAIELLRGVGHACEVLHMDMIFHITNGFNPLNTNSVGGVVFADIIENRRQVEQAIATGVPCLVVNHRVEDVKVNYIAVNNFAGGKTVGEYLIGLGHKRMATITGNVNTQAGLERLEGFRKAIKAAGQVLPNDSIFYGDYSRRSARQAMEQFLSLPQRPTAVFAASDDMALEAMAVCLEKRIKIPNDISIVGFDDNPAALFGPVALTTINQPIFRMAEEGVRWLYSCMQGKSQKLLQKSLSPELIIRDSCAAPARNR